MAFAAAIGPIISGIAGIAGAMMSASAAQSQADAERQVAEWNARELEKEAARRQSAGAVESQKVAREAEQQKAKTRAALAQGGISTTEGLGPLLDQEITKLAFFEENLRMSNAQNDQRNLENKAKVTRWEGEIKASSLEKTANATLLGGFTQGIKGIGGAASSFG